MIFWRTVLDIISNNLVYNEDCIDGMKKRIKNETIDMVFTDPPYGIKGEQLDTHYSRDNEQVIQGYQDISEKDYANFSLSWISEIERILKPGGSCYIVSGWSNLHHVLNALHSTNLLEINHLILEYSFGVYTTNKWVSSHYHLLYWAKKGKRTFNTNCRFSDKKDSYNDRMSVQKLEREYQTKKIRYQNQLPVGVISKYISYSSKENDLICDPFAGSFSTRNAALSLNRNFIGFEINSLAFNEFSNYHSITSFLM